MSATVAPTSPSVSTQRHHARPLIRLAKANEGPVVEWLLLESGRHGTVDGIDWTQSIAPYWLIAEDEDGVAVGCLQVNPGKPLGRLDWMGVPAYLPRRQKALIVRDLLLTGIATCRAQGSQIVAGMIDDTLTDYQRLLVRRGGQAWSKGTMYVVRA